MYLSLGEHWGLMASSLAMERTASLMTGGRIALAYTFRVKHALQMQYWLISHLALNKAGYWAAEEKVIKLWQ